MHHCIVEIRVKFLTNCFDRFHTDTIQGGHQLFVNLIHSLNKWIFFVILCHCCKTYFEVTFDIDANGIVNVSAKDLGTGKEQHITITAGSNMSDDEIDKAVKEAAEFEAQDKKRKEAIDAKNDADAMVFQTEKAMDEVGDKIDAADKAAVEADCKALKELLEKVNMDDISDAQVAEINAGKEKLMQSAQKLFAKVYEQSQGAQGAGPNPGAGAGPNPGPAPEGFDGDDVVDGDYKEV